jgi:hypothetical protein
MATGYQNPVTIGKGQSNLQDFLSDEALFLDFSIFLTSREGAEEIIQDVVDVARAYGFTDIPAVWSATSSFYGNIRAKFKSKDPEAALLSKKELQKDLLGKKQPKSLKKKKAVHKLRGSMLKRAKKRLGTIVVAGAVFLGSFAGEVAKDMAKDEVKSGDHGTGAKGRAKSGWARHERAFTRGRSQVSQCNRRVHPTSPR